MDTPRKIKMRCDAMRNLIFAEIKIESMRKKIDFFTKMFLNYNTLRYGAWPYFTCLLDWHFQRARQARRQELFLYAMS